MSQLTRGLRIGVIVDSPVVHSWEASLIAGVVDLPLVSETTLIISGSPPSVRRRGIREWFRVLPLRVIRRIERAKLQKTGLYERAFSLSDASLMTSQVHRVSPQWSSTGLSWRLSEQDLLDLRSMNLDLIIRLGSGIIKGDVLDVARLGIVSLHHGDNRAFRGVPPGFWEVFTREPWSGYTIQRLTEELDGGQVLGRGRISTQSYFLRNQVVLLLASVPRFLRVVKTLAEIGTLPPSSLSLPYAEPLYRDPGVRDTLHYAWDQVRRLLFKWSQGSLRSRGRWKVYFVRQAWPNAVL